MVISKISWLDSFFLFGFLIGLPLIALADDMAVVLADQVSSVYLCGSLKRETRWGPPGFGETPKVDVKRTVWMVELSRPAAFHYKGDNGKNIEKALRIIQISLVSNVSNHQLHRLQGQAVAVTGSIWSASSEGDVTPVVIKMATIAPLEKSMACTN